MNNSLYAKRYTLNEIVIRSAAKKLNTFYFCLLLFPGAQTLQKPAAFAEARQALLAAAAVPNCDRKQVFILEGLAKKNRDFCNYGLTSLAQSDRLHFRAGAVRRLLFTSARLLAHIEPVIS